VLKEKRAGRLLYDRARVCVHFDILAVDVAVLIEENVPLVDLLSAFRHFVQRIRHAQAGGVGAC
jgi:hypothetical protein